MKKFILIISIFLAAISSKAQTSEPQRPPSIKELRVADPIAHNKSIEIPPKFPGGLEAFKKFINNNFKIPANTNNLQGLIIITFFVETDGSLTGVFVNKKLSPELDKEALRVMSLSPKWAPDIQQDKPVKVKYSVPIRIPLEH